MLNGVCSYRPVLACFRRTSFPVQSVWSIIYPEREFTQTRQAAYWRETIQMPFVQLRLPKERCPVRAPPHTLWWAYLQLSSHSLHLKANSFQNVLLAWIICQIHVSFEFSFTRISFSSLCLHSSHKAIKKAIFSGVVYSTVICCPYYGGSFRR